MGFIPCRSFYLHSPPFILDLQLPCLQSCYRRWPCHVGTASVTLPGGSLSAEIIDIRRLRSLSPSLLGKWTPKGALRSSIMQEGQKGRDVSWHRWWGDNSATSHYSWVVCSNESSVGRTDVPKAVSFVNTDERCELKMWPHSISYLRVAAMRTLNLIGAKNARIFFQSKYNCRKHILKK